MKYNFCPNINSIESKALIAKLGLLGFYKQWIKEQQSVSFDIDDNTQSVASLLFVNREKFSAHQQAETIKSIIFQIQSLRKEGLSKAKDIVGRIKSDFEDTQAFFADIQDDPQAKTIADNLSDVLANFPEFIKRANRELEKTGIKIEGIVASKEDGTITSENDEESTYDSTEAVFQKLNYDDESSFSQSSKDTASGDIKLALSLVPKYVYKDGAIQLDEDGDPMLELNHLQLPQFEDIDTIWKDLLYTLVDVPVGAKMSYLKNSTNPRHQVIYNEIMSNPRTNIQNELEVVFSKQQANFVTVNITKPDRQGAISLRVFDTNRSNANSFLIDNWYETFLQSNIVTGTKEGDRLINSQFGKELKAEFDEIKIQLKTEPDVAIARVVSLFGKIGIKISPKAFSETVKDEAGSNLSGADVINVKLPYFFSRLAGAIKEGEVEDALEHNNPFINDTSSITLLAKLENKANPTVFEDSFISGDGKSKYSFVNNSYLSHKVRKLKGDLDYLEALAKTPFASKSYWLTNLRNNPQFRNNFGVFYTDTLGNEKSNQVNKPFKRMSTKEKEFTRISLFQNQGRGTSNEASDIGYFVGLTPSDKTTIPVFKTLKVNVKVNSELKFNSETMEVMYDQIMSEYNRVKQTIEQNDDPNIQKIDMYHGKNGNGAKFVVFTFLNDVLLKDGKLVELDDVRLYELVKPELEKFLKDLTTDQIKYWESLDLFDEHILDKSYKNKIGFTPANKEASLRGFAANYAVNQFIFMMNQTQLISGDPALHGKKSVAATWINFYKRMAKDIAPGLDGNFQNSTFNTLFLEDLKYDSSLLNEYNEKVGEIGQAYAGLNPADAQEYTTLQEHLDVMEAYGRLTGEGREAGQRLLDGGSDPNDMAVILQPMKPVYVNDKIEDNIDKLYYIKTSSFPLIPALTSGLEIDKLRQAMESKNIQRAVYRSGVKLGIQGDVSVISNDGYVKFNELDIKPSQIINLDRAGFRIQQELPYHGDHGGISEGSQARKLILNNLSDEETLTYNGNTITGKEAKNLFEQLHMERMDRAFDKFKGDIGFDETLGKFTDLTAIESILKEEATLRNYPINDIYSIQLIKENGENRFKVPLGFTNNSSRFESILNALVSNRVIKQSLPGFMKVQGAAAGFSKIAGFDEANAVVKSGIVWTNPNDTILEYTKSKDGTLTGADILVPSWFHGVDLRTYVREDGSLDTDRLPSELLTLIGVRIPTQGYNSMMKFMVKGFLPSYMGDLAIVPSEIVIQMGSDFDVDKLFLYRYNYNMDKEGNFSRLPLDTSDITKLDDTQIEDAIMQMFVDRMSDERLLDQMLEPNGFGKLPEVANKVASIQKSDKAVHTFSTKDQNNIHRLNNDGKAGTGVFSLFSTFNKTAQDAGLTLYKPMVFKDSTGKNVMVGDFSKISGIEGQKKSSVIAYLQSAAVDNSKEQILGKLNINDVTMPIAGTLAMLGLDESFIGYFLSQPIILDYVTRIQQSNDIIKGEFDPSLERKIKEDITKKYVGDESGQSEEVKKIIGMITYGNKELLQYLEEGNKDTNLPTNLSAEEQNLIKNVNQAFQYKVFLDFLEVKEYAANIRAIQSAINVDTNGLGSSFTNLVTKTEKINTLLETIQKEHYPIANVDKIFKGNIIDKATQILYKTRNIYSNILPQGTMSYNQAIKQITEGTGLILTDNNLGDIYKNIKSYILTSPNIIHDVEAERTKLLHSDNNIAKRWQVYSETPEGRRNILTQRIKPRFAGKKGDINTLTALNTPASNNSTDIDNAIMYFYDMLENGTDTERELAADLVKYYIVTGAQFGPSSIGKYISFDVLEKANFSARLRKIESDMNKGFILEGFIDQYFQNNPTKAKSFSGEVTGSSYGTMEEPELMTEAGNMASHFNVYDNGTSKFRLFKKTGTGITGFIYEEIPVLTSTKTQIKNYNMAKATSAPVVDKPARPSVPTELPVRSVATPETLSQDYNIEGGVSAVLTTIVNNSNNAYYRSTAQDLLNNLPQIGTIKLNTENDRNANGTYNSETHTVSLSLPIIIRNAKGDVNAKFEEVILHELLHAGTVRKINKYDELRQEKTVPQMVADGDFTKEEVLAMNGIHKLYNNYLNTIDKEGFEKFKKLAHFHTSGQEVTEEEQQYLRDNKDKYYALYNIKEFIAAGLTNPTFSDKLKKGNFFMQFLNYITDLLGLNRNDLDALYSNSMSLMSENPTSVVNNITSSESPFTDDISDSDRLEFVAQRNEFLRAYKKQIGSVISADTLAKIKASAEANTKYSYLKISGWQRPDGRLELRVGKAPVIDYDIDVEGDGKTDQDKFIDRVISKFNENLDKLTAKERQLGTSAPADLAVKIEKLKAQIADLMEKRSIGETILATENKIKEIRKALKNSTFTADDLYEYKSYINTLITLNQQIAFGDEFQDLTNRLNNVSAEAVKLNNVLRQKEIQTVQSWLSDKVKLDIDLKANVVNGVKDTGFGESNFLDFGQSSSDVIQSIGYSIEKAKFNANQQHDEFVDEFKPLLEAFLKKYKTYDMFLQKDKNGKPTGYLLNKFNQEFYDKSKGNFKFFNANTTVSYKPNGKEEYLADRATALETLSEEDYSVWLKLNSPELYMSDWGKGKKPEGRGAQKYLNITPNDKWIDPSYLELKSKDENDPAVKFYNFIEPIIRKTSGKYGQQSNFIPEIHKTTLDYFVQGNMKGGFANFNKELIESITVDLSHGNNQIDEFTGELRPSIPVGMFGGKMEAQDKTYDLARIVEAVQYQEFTLTAKREIEPLLNIYYSILRDSKSINTRPDGTEVVIDKAPSRILDQSNFLIQSYLYNKTKEIEGVTSKKIGDRNIATSAVTDAIISYVRVKGMALNPFSAIGNILQGLTSNFITGTGGEYFGTGDNFKAFGTMLHSISGNTDTSHKILALINKFDVFTKANEMNFGASREIKSTQNKLNNLSWFELQERGEYFIQGQTLLAMLYAKKDTNGKSWFDSFDKDGNWTGEGENPVGDQDKLFKFTQEIKAALIDVHGNYSREMPAKKHFYTRAMMVFRTWIPQAVNVRFGEESKDLLSGKVKKGRYRSYNAFLRNEDGMIDFNAAKDNIMWLMGAKGTTLSDVDKINMRKNIAELALIGAITLLILMLKAAIHDLDDDEKNGTTYIINSLARSQSDLTFFMLPSSFQTITKDPIPLMTVLKDNIELVQAGFSSITGDPVYKAGPRKGKSRLYKEMVDNFPIITQIDKNITYAGKVF
jgi:hypothetical protein